MKWLLIPVYLFAVAFALYFLTNQSIETQGAFWAFLTLGVLIGSVFGIFMLVEKIKSMK